ncbi:helix-turn-helix domain-containing protein [Cellulophaga baltica]|uniref:helix-turn-helix domain-containing protein n=1 Tax=Cellulophaga baltica TaxID=76594 RepID=UPI00249513B9|nr:helix-turn-helix transcriptional regulator [Cellulophaga baltica]
MSLQTSLILLNFHNSMKGQIRNEELLLKIALKFKELRSLKGVTQEEVYNDTGVHISRIETGKINITVSTLEHLCIYFNLELWEFFSVIKY